MFEGAAEKFSDVDAQKLQKRFVGTVVLRPLKEGKIGMSRIH